jgi:exopolysaccharide biosynthesis protein
VFTTSKSGATASFEEIQDIVEQFNPKYALLGDGGGSTILDVGGNNMIASAGNRVLAYLIQF